MINQPCSQPALFSSTCIAGGGALTARVARLQAKLADSMLKKQETWKPESLVSLGQPLTTLLPLLLRRAAATAGWRARWRPAPD